MGKVMTFKVKPPKVRGVSLINTGTKVLKDRRQKRLKQRLRREIQEVI